MSAPFDHEDPAPYGEAVVFSMGKLEND